MGADVKDTRKGGRDARTLGNFLKVAVKIFLLFGSETWVTTPCVIRTLGGFQYRVDHQITGKQTCNFPYSGWKYPPMRELMGFTA